jgi:tripartite-type tricarboxylate transporter receptor subunit TctC
LARRTGGAVRQENKGLDRASASITHVGQRGDDRHVPNGPGGGTDIVSRILGEAETGIPYNVTSWYGMAFPAGTPDAIVTKMNKAVREALADPQIIEQIKKTGIAAKSSPPDELEKHVTAEIAKWKKLIADADITKLE